MRASGVLFGYDLLLRSKVIRLMSSYLEHTFEHVDDNNEITLGFVPV